MQKTFCDICEQPAHRSGPNRQVTLKDKVLSDKEAKIEIRLSFGFREHSTGFGGPPDLCNACRVMAINELLKAIEKGVCHGSESDS